MENKITLPKLAVMLALASGKQKKVCEDFLKELFAIVAEELENGGNVRIKGFGTFKLIDVEPRKSVNVVTGEDTTIPGHAKVIFVAAKELASRVNLPFEAFEAVEISDDLSTSALEGDAEPDDANLQYEAEVMPETLSETEENVGFESSQKVVDTENDDKVSTYSREVKETQSVVSPLLSESNDENLKSVKETEPLEPKGTHSLNEGEENIPSDSEENVKTVDNSSAHTQPVYESSDTDQPLEYESYEEPKPGRHRFAWGFVSGFIAALVGCVAFIGICYFYGYNFSFYKSGQIAEIPTVSYNGDTEIKTDIIKVDSTVITEPADSIVTPKDKSQEEDIVPTKASDEPVYDTVSTTRYLTTIAKEHYGNFNLWPIIYEENQKILGHPDRIPPGTRVVVPPLSKYGVNPTDAEQIKAIKQKGLDIYARFK